MNNEQYNPTCLITGRTDNLRMYPLRNDAGAMIGWLFLHESVNFKTCEAEVKWNYKFRILAEQPTDHEAKANQPPQQ